MALKTVIFRFQTEAKEQLIQRVRLVKVDGFIIILSAQHSVQCFVSQIGVLLKYVGQQDYF